MVVSTTGAGQRITLATGLFIVHVCLLAIATNSTTPREKAVPKSPVVVIRLISETQASLPKNEPISVSTLSRDVAPIQDRNDAIAPPSVGKVSALRDIVEKSIVAKPPGIFLPSSSMDRRPTPFSEPDMQMVNATPASGLPLKLRIFVNSLGRVVNVTPISASPLDSDFVDDVIVMFRATTFLPGQSGGVDVDSYLDIELATQFKTLLPVPMPSDTAP